MLRLTLKQRRFVDAYFVTNGNKSEAARRAGYADPYAQGEQVYNAPPVKAEIQSRLDREAMPANEVLARLARHARGTIADVFEVPSGGSQPPVFSPQTAFENGAIHNVKAITTNTDGSVKVEMYDAQSALVQLGRHHKLFTDKSEVNAQFEVIGEASQSLDAKLLPGVAPPAAGGVSRDPDRG